MCIVYLGAGTECVCMFWGERCFWFCMCARARVCVWRKEGLRRTVTFDLASEGWQGLGAPVACFTETIFSDLKQAHTDCQPASWWLVPCFFFIIYFSLLQWNFIEGWKAFSSCCVTNIKAWKQALVSVALVRLLMLWMRRKSLWLALCMADCLTSSFYLAFHSCIRYIQYIWKK